MVRLICVTKLVDQNYHHLWTKICDTKSTDCTLTLKCKANGEPDMRFKENKDKFNKKLNEMQRQN